MRHTKLHQNGGDDMKALIMAGGEGTRLRPLTCYRPKPMVDFLGKPLLKYSLELLKKHGISPSAYRKKQQVL